jgi:regulator of cell morphogenesis and NO signaling
MKTAAIPAEGDWESQSTATIIDFILRRFHEPLRRDLPRLINSARLVESEQHPLGPRGLTEHLEQIKLSVESHLEKEEKILFPLIGAGRGAMAFMPIKVMMAEHEDHLANLARTRALTHGFVLPPEANTAWQTLYQDLQQLESDLNAHIHLENNILFTRVMGNDVAQI